MPKGKQTGESKKVKEEDKIKLRIERLKINSDCYKWEINQYNSSFMGLIVIFVGIFIPTMILLDYFWHKVGAVVALIFLLFLSYFFIIVKNSVKEKTKKIDNYHKEINQLYEKLGI